MPMLDSYIFFDGNCAEAMQFYARTLGGKLQGIMKYSDAPPGPGQEACPPGDENRVMHASILIDGRNLMASDTPKGQFKPMQGFSLSLFYDTAEEAKRIHDALLEGGGTVMMPFAETFWAKGFGAFTDRFGTPWMVSGGAKMPPPQ